MSRIQDSGFRIQGAVKAGLFVCAICAICAICGVLFGQSIVRNADQVLSLVFNATNATLQTQFVTTAPDPCQNPYVGKSSVAITASGQLVALAAGKTIYVCGYSFTAATGTGATYQFTSGTGTNCGTGTVNQTGTMLGGSPITAGFGSTIFSGGSGNAVCLALGGTSPSAQGIFTYVQQ